MPPAMGSAVELARGHLQHCALKLGEWQVNQKLKALVQGDQRVMKRAEDLVIAACDK